MKKNIQLIQTSDHEYINRDELFNRPADTFAVYRNGEVDPDWLRQQRIEHIQETIGFYASATARGVAFLGLELGKAVLSTIRQEKPVDSL